jgi:hypothetical protein
VLFETVWLIYALDRWLDAWKLNINKPHSSRHAFYLHYRWQVAAIWFTVFGCTAIISLTELSQQTLLSGFALLGLCGLYFILVHLKPSWGVIPKEIRVGVAVSLGVTLCLWSQVTSGTLLLELALATFCFTLLISLNCIVIALWETSLDAAQGYSSIARFETRAWLIPFTLSFLGLTLALGVLAPSVWRTFYLPVFFAALALLVLHRARTQLGTSLLRVLADAVLLTPLLFLSLIP